MLTINADTHPMFKEMHRPDPARPLHVQDKRMVVILPPAQYEAWLDAPAQRAMEFMNQFPAERLAMVAEPLPPAPSKAEAGESAATTAAATVLAVLKRVAARARAGGRRVKVQVGVTAGGDAQDACLLCRTRAASCEPAPRFGSQGRGPLPPTSDP